jgi:hypothetical protein
MPLIFAPPREKAETSGAAGAIVPLHKIPFGVSLLVVPTGEVRVVSEPQRPPFEWSSNGQSLCPQSLFGGGK